MSFTNLGLEESQQASQNRLALVLTLVLRLRGKLCGVQQVQHPIVHQNVWLGNLSTIDNDRVIATKQESNILAINVGKVLLQEDAISQVTNVDEALVVEDDLWEDVISDIKRVVWWITTLLHAFRIGK